MACGAKSIIISAAPAKLSVYSVDEIGGVPVIQVPVAE